MCIGQSPLYEYKNVGYEIIYMYVYLYLYIFVYE